MVSGKSKILCLILTIVILMGCGTFPSFASYASLVGCSSSGGDQNTTPPPNNTPVPVTPVYDTTDINSYNLYFGKLNSHSNQSDGILSLDGIYKYARDVAKLDFLAVTDNSDMLDNGAPANLGNGSASSGWKAGKAAADSYTSGKFVGIYGFEMAWTNGNGHINTYNTEGFETSTESPYTGSSGLLNYYTAFEQYPSAILQFNHPGARYGDFADFGYIGRQIADKMSLIEVGSGEGKVGSAKYYPSYDDYTRALDLGWRLAPTNGQDLNDTGTARTVVLARSLNRNEIYNAIKNRRVYATEDQNLKIRYSINGQAMGSSLSAKPANLHLLADLEEAGGESIGMVSVIAKGGKVVKSQTLAVSRYTLDLVLPPDYSYYYIRVDQVDKDIAVTAPIWVPSDTKAGISKTYLSTAAPKKGEKLQITTEIYNKENTNMQLSELTFLANGKEIKTLSNPGTVKPGTTGKYSIDFTPSQTGSVRIDILLEATVKGVERTYSDAFSMNVVDSVTLNTGIRDSYPSTNTPRKGEKLQITTEIYNNENRDMKLSTLSFQADGKEIKTLNNPGTVKPGSTGKFSIDYTPVKTGSVKIDILLDATVKGIEKIYTDSFVMNVSDSVNLDAGIRDSYPSTNTPRKGEKLQITTEIYNDENKDMKLSSLSFLANGKEIKTLNNPGTVKPYTTGKFSVDYVPTQTGSVKIEIRLKATLKGIERTYSDSFTINVADPTQAVTDAVKAVISLIDKIKWAGNKLQTSHIEKAREAYDALTNAEKKLVSNYDKLVYAEQWLQWEKEWEKWQSDWHNNWGHHKGNKK